MRESGTQANTAVDFKFIGIQKAREVRWNLAPAELIKEATRKGKGILADTGTLACDTGKFIYKLL